MHLPPSDPEQLDLILEALRLYIHIFWPSGESRDWNILVQDLLVLSRSLETILPKPSQALKQSANQLRKEPDPAQLSCKMESCFVKLFISHSRGIAAPLYHSCYQEPRGLLMREPAREMGKLLDMAGLEPASCSREPADHLCIELEYLFFLLSSLHESDDPDLHQFACEFAGDFMLPWIKRWTRAIPTDGEGIIFYQLAVLLVEILQLTRRVIQEKVQIS